MTGSKDRLIDVVVTLPLPRPLTYRLPEEWGEVPVGAVVQAPVGRRLVTGYVWGPAATRPEATLKPVHTVLDPAPRFTAETAALFQWVADYYHYPLGEVLRTAIPGGGRAGSRERWVRPIGAELPPATRLGPKARALLAHLEAAGPTPLAELARVFPRPQASLKRLAARGLVKLSQRPVRHDPLGDQEPPSPAPPLILSPEQTEAAAAISAGLARGGFSPFLLHGVTASGKTEVYLTTAAQALEAGRTVLALLPEIALTHPVGTAFRQRFGPRVTLLHSGLSETARLDQWRRIAAGEIDVVVGARSAVFAPLPRLGLIVVDEEHDPAYKHEGGLPYQARDVALVRGRLSGAAVVLGSATPAVTTYYRAQQGAYRYLSLSQRVTPQPLPRVHLLNLREHRQSRRLPLISTPLRLALTDTLDKGEQALLFLNRRGYANVLFCLFCGHVCQCVSCSVSLTLHKSAGVLRCHYCGFAQPVPEVCPNCMSPALKRYGVGTEQVEQEVVKLFPQARVARVDRDTAPHSGKAVALFAEFKDRQWDILVGTQMLSKGHDFPQVTLVGVVAADLSLYFPEFNAGERTFQLLAQVAGRAGRGQTPGQVMIQTLHPEHYALQATQEHDYTSFYTAELATRRELGYPPFTRLALLRLRGTDAVRVEQASRRLISYLSDLISQSAELATHVRVLGPSPAPVARLSGYYRWQLLLKSYGHKPLRQVLVRVQDDQERLMGPGVSLLLDVDPVDMH